MAVWARELATTPRELAARGCRGKHGASRQRLTHHGVTEGSADQSHRASTRSIARARRREVVKSMSARERGPSDCPRGLSRPEERAVSTPAGALVSERSRDRDLNVRVDDSSLPRLRSSEDAPCSRVRARGSATQRGHFQTPSLVAAAASCRLPLALLRAPGWLDAEQELRLRCSCGRTHRPLPPFTRRRETICVSFCAFCVSACRALPTATLSPSAPPWCAGNVAPN